MVFNYANLPSLHQRKAKICSEPRGCSTNTVVIPSAAKI